MEPIVTLQHLAHPPWLRCSATGRGCKCRGVHRYNHHHVTDAVQLTGRHGQSAREIDSAPVTVVRCGGTTAVHDAFVLTCRKQESTCTHGQQLVCGQGGNFTAHSQSPSGTDGDCESAFPDGALEDGGLSGRTSCSVPRINRSGASTAFTAQHLGVTRLSYTRRIRWSGRSPSTPSELSTGGGGRTRPAWVVRWDPTSAR